MNPSPVVHARIPRLEVLGSDLLRTTPRQRLLARTRPFLGLIAYGRNWPSAAGGREEPVLTQCAPLG